MIRQQTAWVMNTLAPFHTMPDIEANWKVWSSFITDVLGVRTTDPSRSGADVLFATLKKCGFHTVNAVGGNSRRANPSRQVDAATVSEFLHLAHSLTHGDLFPSLGETPQRTPARGCPDCVAALRLAAIQCQLRRSDVRKVGTRGDESTAGGGANV